MIIYHIFNVMMVSDPFFLRLCILQIFRNISNVIRRRSFIQDSSEIKQQHARRLSQDRVTHSDELSSQKHPKTINAHQVKLRIEYVQSSQSLREGL